MEVKFDRNIDTSLYLVLLINQDYRQATKLILSGADINASCRHSDIGQAFMLGALLNDLVGDDLNKIDMVKFFMHHGFNPNTGDGLNGAQALNYFIAFAHPTNKLIESVKLLLDKGCDANLEYPNYLDEGEMTSAVDTAYWMLFDGWVPDFDFLAVQGFSPICQILSRAVKRQNYQNISSVSRIIGEKIRKVVVVGDGSINALDSGNRYLYEGEWDRGVFSSGIIIECEKHCVFIDSYLASFCDACSFNAESETELSLDLTGQTIKAVTGRIFFNCQDKEENDEINFILSNGYVLKFKLAGKSEDGKQKCVLSYQRVTDELSEKYQNALELEKSFASETLTFFG